MELGVRSGRGLYDFGARVSLRRARNVVATLWLVDDRGAAEFATRFYRHFPAVPAAEAPARAQRGMLAGSRWRAPYYWAGYVIQGEGGTGRRAQKEGTLSVR